MYLYIPGLLKSRRTFTLPLYENGIFNNPYNDEIIFTVSFLNLSSLGSGTIMTPFPSAVSQRGRKSPGKMHLQLPQWKEVPLTFSALKHDDDPGSLACPECTVHLLHSVFTQGRSSSTAQETSLLPMSPHHQNCKSLVYNVFCLIYSLVFL